MQEINSESLKKVIKIVIFPLNFIWYDFSWFETIDLNLFIEVKYIYPFDDEEYLKNRHEIKYYYDKGWKSRSKKFDRVV